MPNDNINRTKSLIKEDPPAIYERSPSFHESEIEPLPKPSRLSPGPSMASNKGLGNINILTGKPFKRELSRVAAECSNEFLEETALNMEAFSSYMLNSGTSSAVVKESQEDIPESILLLDGSAGSVSSSCTESLTKDGSDGAEMKGVPVWPRWLKGRGKESWV